MKWYYFLFSLLIVTACNSNKLEPKGFQVNEIVENNNGKKVVGLKLDSLTFQMRPRNVLSTKHEQHRVSPIYKVNYTKDRQPFYGSNQYHTTWLSNRFTNNNWNDNFMPGFEAIYGYNFVNVSHFNVEMNTQNLLFESPVLIKTFYYPAFSNDTLNGAPVERNFYMVSVYNDDTNHDGYLTTADLRRLIWFDLNGDFKDILVPNDYSVMSSEYDMANDYMYVFAKFDENSNGQIEEQEPMHIFWVHLANPANRGIVYN